MKNIFWTGYCDEERHDAINTIQAIISKYGSITDFRLFSDISLTLIVEIASSNINALYSELKLYMGLDNYEAESIASKKEVSIFLNITFAKSTGNLRIEVPAVPG